MHVREEHLTTVGGVSPYTAVFGKFPRILEATETATLSLLDDSAGTHRNAQRLREIALRTMVETHAQNRLKAIEDSKSRPPGQLLGLEVGG